MTETLLYGLLCLAGGIITAVTGFGFCLVVMMFLPYIWPQMGYCAAVVGLVSVTLSAIVSARMAKKIRIRTILWPLIGSFLITVPAMLFWKNGANLLLTRLFGAILVLFSLWFLKLGARVKLPAGPAAGLVTGGLSGLFGSLFSTSGPPVAAYLLLSDMDHDSYMATLQLYFTLTSLQATVMRVMDGEITGRMTLLAMGGVALGLLGMYWGRKAAHRLPAKAIRLCVCVLMGVSGINLLLK